MTEQEEQTLRAAFHRYYMPAKLYDYFLDVIWKRSKLQIKVSVVVWLITGMLCLKVKPLVGEIILLSLLAVWLGTVVALGISKGVRARSINRMGYYMMDKGYHYYSQDELENDLRELNLIK